jgi:cobalt-zinc-cadmium efflux system outer membrane protein
LNDILANIGSTRPDVQAARSRSDEAIAQIAVARRSVFQGITVIGGAAIGTNNRFQVNPTMDMPVGQTGQEVDLSLGVSFPIALVDRGQGTIPASQARAVAQHETANALQLAAEQRVVGAYHEMERRRETLRQYIDTGVANSLGMRSEAEAGYREGRMQVLDLVDAYLAVRDARLRIVTLARDTRNAEINLWRAAGERLTQQ